MTDTNAFEPAEEFPIDDLETLGIIIGEPRIEIIEMLRQPLSVAELAGKMDVPRTRLYHHIKMLEEVGAIVVVDERRAGAMTEKIYQVAAKSFQPSEKFLESAAPKEQAEAILDSVFSITKTDFLRAVERKLVSMKDAEQARRLTIARHLFTLTPERITELVTRLEELLSEFKDEETEDTEPFGLLVVGHPSSRSTK
jgi:DNA-binding transcriptional ArsR family regulator